MEEIRERVKQMDSAEATLLAAREAESVRAEARALGFLLATLGVATTGFFHLFDGIRKQLAIRTRAEEQLRRSEENLAVTLQSIGDAVLTTDLQRRVTRLNPVAEKLTGWTRADAAGKPVEQVFRIVNEETRQPAVIPVDSVLETGEIHGLANHTVLIARDGTERPIADSAAPIRGRGGQTIGVVLVFRDVTAEQAAENALRASETRYRTLFESLDEGFCVVEMIFDEQNKPLDYRFLETNPSFEKQSGLQNALGKTMRELAPGLESHWFETLGRVALTGEPVRYQNRAEQLGRSFDLYAFRIEDPARRRVAILFNDVTERLAAEAKVRQLNTDLERRAAQLDAANKELEAFSYSVSHDLRAPLRHVQGYAEMLQQATEGKLPADAERYLKIIHKAGQDMGQLIDDLLAFCRTGRTEMREGTAPLNPLIADVIRGQELSIKDRNVEWKIASLPMVVGDAALLKQVLANLVGNAVKYSRQRDPAVIEIGQAGEEEGRGIFFVRDNGAGFNMDYAEKLFGVFQRLHRAEEFEGTGIGLATVRRIIARHGGRTWAEGEVNKGATFYFTLKLA